MTRREKLGEVGQEPAVGPARQNLIARNPFPRLTICTPGHFLPDQGLGASGPGIRCVWRELFRVLCDLAIDDVPNRKNCRLPLMFALCSPMMTLCTTGCHARFVAFPLLKKRLLLKLNNQKQVSCMAT